MKKVDTYGVGSIHVKQSNTDIESVVCVYANGMIPFSYSNQELKPILDQAVHDLNDPHTIKLQDGNFWLG